jgi:pimeloyl-ACP methyl ester carboxylesterase
MFKLLRATVDATREFVDRTKVQVENRSLSFLFKVTFKGLPTAPSTQPMAPAMHQFQMVRACCLLAKHTYRKPEHRATLPELGQLVFDQPRSGKFRVPFFIMNSDPLNRIFVACRGSYCLNDFLTDADAAPEPWADGFVHGGILKTTLNTYATIRDFLIALSSNFNQRPITFVGHSLGASVAALLCEMFAKDFQGIPVTSVIFAPAAAFTRNLWERSTARCTSYITEGDFVPFLSLYNFEALPPGQLPAFISDAIHSQIQKQMQGKEASRFATGGLTSIPLFPPGDGYLMVFPPGDLPAGHEMRKIVSCDYFARLTCDLNEMRHACSGYLHWIDRYGMATFNIPALVGEVGDDDFK